MDASNKSRVQQQIDALISSFFSVFDNRNGAIPRLASLSDCFADKATIAHRTGTGPALYTVMEFAKPRIDLLTHGELKSFYEWEVSSATQIFDGVAARTSRYRKAGLLKGSDYSGSGTKCFHLVEFAIGWRIASVAWVDDNL
jgi:hypothetical protein